MSFDSLIFMLCFGGFLVLYRLLPMPRVLALAASLAFYAVAGWFDLGLVLAVKIANFWLSRFVTPDKVAPERVGNRKLRLILIIATNVATLAFFKYRSLLTGGSLSQNVFGMDIVIPLGISFYIFQIIAYQVDVYRGTVARITSLPSFLLFSLYFPQLIAGPIVRASQLAPQIHRLSWWGRKAPKPRIAISFGLGLITLGLIKKVLLADAIAPWVDAGFAEGVADSFTGWVIAWAFSFQIYFDFSGYSDMAVGMAALMGIRLPINFRQPFLSRSPQEFWRRWHITLSSWIRDYLYIPLGGNRGGALRNALVLIAVMGLAGLWHGANWTFILWGLLWGAVIFLWRPFRHVLQKVPGLDWALVMLAVVVLFVLFRAADIHSAVQFIATLFGGGGEGTMRLGDSPGDRLWMLAGCAALMGLHWLERRLLSLRTVHRLMRRDHPLVWGLLLGLCLWMVLLPKISTTPFIYFRF